MSSCAEISPQLCLSDWESERLAQNDSNRDRELVLEYFDESPLDPIAHVKLFPLVDHIACDAPRVLNSDERLNGDMKRGGAWDFNPCGLENNQNAKQFYQIDVPLGENYFLEIVANDPNNRSLNVQVVNVHSDAFSCENPMARSCIPTQDLADDDGRFLFRLDASWGAGRDPARAIIAVSGATTFLDSGYWILLRNGRDDL